MTLNQTQQAVFEFIAGTDEGRAPRDIGETLSLTYNETLTICNALIRRGLIARTHEKPSCASRLCRPELAETLRERIDANTALRQRKKNEERNRRRRQEHALAQAKRLSQVWRRVAPSVFHLGAML